MKMTDARDASRRQFLRAAAAIAGTVALSGLPVRATAAASAMGRSIRIGVIGSGKLGGTVGELWVKAGHQAMFSARNLDKVKQFVAGLGPNASAGTPKEAAAFGEVLLIAVPYSALPQLGRDLADEIKGKVVLDACNPIERRDGPMAIEARSKGTGVASPQLLPGARLVRAFSSVGASALRSGAHRAGDRIGIPLAADDQEALKIAAQLVEDAGFEPVVVGPLARAKEFDVGTPVFGKALTAKDLRQRLGLPS